jgi:hypothetical protein
MVLPQGTRADHADTQWSPGIRIPTPRSLCSTKSRNRVTSVNGSHSARARATSLRHVVLGAEQQAIGALELFHDRSREKPLRCNPTLFRPNSLTGLPTAFTYGGTSCATREHPPTNACGRCFTN